MSALTKEVAERLRFDIGPLQRYLEDHVEGFSGELQVRQFRGGQSCPTYLLEAGGKSYVLRRKPPGKLLPSAHAVDYEAVGDPDLLPLQEKGGLKGRDLEALGLPTLEQYRDAYCRRTGRDGIPHWNFYLAYNLFRSAGIAQGIAGRVRDGTAASSHAKEVGESVPRTAGLAWEVAQRA